MTEEFITVSNLAKILGISSQAMLKQIKGKINAGDIETRTEGTTYLIKFSSLPEDIRVRYENSQKEAAENANVLGQKLEKDSNYESELWAAADKLRGSVDPSEYKYIVLGLIFLKYVSDSFYQQREKLNKWMNDSSNKKYYIPVEKAREKMLDDKELYKGEKVFYIPEVARWEFLRSKAALPNIAEYIESAMEAIEKANPEYLAGVLPKSFVRLPLESYVIGELVNIFSRIEFNQNAEKEKDRLGQVYEYFIGHFADAEGKRGGSFFTPRSLVKLLVEILEPFENARVLDPCAGSGGMFIQSGKFLKEHHKNPNKIAIYGQESNETTLKLCKMNLAIRGVFGNIDKGNTYYDNKFPDLRVDFVLANPPFNAEWDPERLSDKDPRMVYGTPPSGNANFMWIQHFIHHLAPNGMAGFVMANGALAVGGKEGAIRQKIIEADLVDVIIACPPKLFYNVALPVSLWFLTKNKESGRFRNRKGETLFIDARETFTQISRKQVTFTDEQIQKIANTARSWRGEKEAREYRDVAGYCKAVNLEEISKNGYILTPGRYVGVPEEKDDGIPFEVKVKNMNKELLEYFEESKKLEKQIVQNLRKIKV
jgi:type I restriction enzyme M protein